MAEYIGGVPYEESDTDLPRNRGGRIAVFLGSVIGSLLVGGFIGAYLLSRFDIPGMGAFGFVLGAMASQYWFAGYAPLFFVKVPQAQAFVTINDWIALFNVKNTNPHTTFGPGTSIEYPWASRSNQGNISLKIITIPFKEKVPGKDTQLIVSGSYQFKADFRQAPKFIGVDESTIRGGAIDLILSDVSQKLANESGDAAKAKIKEYNQELERRFGVETAVEEDKGTPEPQKVHKPGDPLVEEFEKRYGIASVAVTITGIDFPPDVQKTRDAIDEAAQAPKTVAKMFGLEPGELKQMVKSGKITPENYMDMLDRTMAQGKSAGMNIQALKLSGFEGLLKALGIGKKGE